MSSKNVKNIIKEYFFVNSTIRLRVRQIERATKTPLPSVVRYVEELKEEGVLKAENVSGILLYSADRSSKSYLLEKRLFNIKQLFDAGLIEYLIKEYHNAPIILFGSYSRGEDLENSDIDLYLESPKKGKPNLSKFEKSLQRNIQIFKHKTINGIGNKELANNIINGITLNGFLEVIK